MPEFPEVNIQVQYLRERCLGWPIHSYGYEGWSHFQNLPEEGRDAALNAFFSNNKIVDIRQRGKQIVMHTEKGLFSSHLMFKGRWSVASDPFTSNYKQHKKLPTEKSNNFWIESDAGRLNFHEPDYKGKISLFIGADDAGNVEHLSRLGPEVLVTPETDPAFSSEWSFDAFSDRAGRSKQAIKAFLLDQKKQSGIGNIYACEALYSARIAPTRPAKSLSQEEQQELYDSIRSLLQQAIDSNLEYEPIVRIYRKKEDPNGNPVSKDKVVGRDTFWVPAVQK